MWKFNSRNSPNLSKQDWNTLSGILLSSYPILSDIRYNQKSQGIIIAFLDLSVRKFIYVEIKLSPLVYRNILILWIIHRKFRIENLLEKVFRMWEIKSTNLRHWRKAGVRACFTSRRHIILRENVLRELLQSNYTLGRDFSPTLPVELGFI